MTLDELHDWVFDGLGFCGCGDPEGALDFMRSVLLVIRKRHDENDDGDQDTWTRNSEALDQLIGMKRGAPLGSTTNAMAWTYLYFLDSKGLLEHGGNCSGSWLTEKGDEVLDALLKFDSEAIINHDEQAESVLDAEVLET